MWLIWFLVFVCFPYVQCTHHIQNACEYVRDVGWENSKRDAFTWIKINMHQQLLTPLSYFASIIPFSSHLFSVFFFSFFLISTIIMLDYSLPALRLTIAKLLIKFSNINPIVVSVSHRYSLLFLKKIKWETNRNIKRAI